jgi:CRP-like cAMP-binding protein
MPYISPRSNLSMRFKGATGYVLDILAEYAIDGICTLSHDDISMLTGYCPRTVATSLHRLIQHQFVRVVKLPREKRNSYEVPHVCAQTSA